MAIEISLKEFYEEFRQFRDEFNQWRGANRERVVLYGLVVTAIAAPFVKEWVT